MGKSLLAAIFNLEPVRTKILGAAGEHWTKQALRGLPSDKYIIMNDLLLNVDGHTHQIDHVVVSKYGIFSIESKQYNGLIVGNKYDKNWIRYAGKKKIYYENPIRQNYGHVKALSQLLYIDESMIHNIVCIPSNAKLNIKHDGELVRNYTLVERIMSYNAEVIDDVNSIVNIINSYNVIDPNVRQQHINNIRTNIIDHDKYYKCPKCGGHLIERHGKYGSFMGCTNFPKCRYTEKNE